MMNDTIKNGKRTLTLDSRLSCAASFVRDGAVVADIGTDHAYIPIYLLERGIARFAIASDINRGPLERARKNASEYGLADKMRFTLANGLEGIEPEREGVTDIVICGMGGELIASIIGASEYTKKDGVKLILQPMSCAAELREFLAKNGYRIADEQLCRAAGKIYTCILAEYDGVVREYGELSLMLGEHNIARGGKLFCDYAQTFKTKLEVKIKGLISGERDASHEKELLCRLETLIAEKN